MHQYWAQKTKKNQKVKERQRRNGMQPHCAQKTKKFRKLKKGRGEMVCTYTGLKNKIESYKKTKEKWYAPIPG